MDLNSISLHSKRAYMNWNQVLVSIKNIIEIYIHTPSTFKLIIDYQNQVDVLSHLEWAQARARKSFV